MKYELNFGEGPFDLQEVTLFNIRLQNWTNVLLLTSISDSQFQTLSPLDIISEICGHYQSSYAEETSNLSPGEVLIQFIKRLKSKLPTECIEKIFSTDSIGWFSKRCDVSLKTADDKVADLLRQLKAASAN